MLTGSTLWQRTNIELVATLNKIGLHLGLVSILNQIGPLLEWIFYARSFPIS